MDHRDDEWRTTSTIVDRLKRFDDRTTWDLIVDHFREPVVRLAQRMGLSAQDAQDVAQETLIAFADSMRSGRFDREKGRLKSWLFGIAHRQALAARGRTARNRAHHVDLPDDPGASDGVLAQDDPAEELWEQEWRAAIYRRALRQIQREVNPRTYEIFEMSAIEGRPAEEVMERFGVAKTVVYNTRNRLAQRLRQLRDEYDDV